MGYITLTLVGLVNGKTCSIRFELKDSLPWQSGLMPSIRLAAPTEVVLYPLST